MDDNHLSHGVKLFKEGKYEASITEFTKALEQTQHKAFLVYDSRSSAYQKLGNYKLALQDSKKTIAEAPTQWQGYARAAQILYTCRKLDASLKMVDMAISRAGSTDPRRLATFQKLRADVQKAQVDDAARLRSKMDHLSSLPVELFTEIASMVSRDAPTGPLLLTHVCKRWRAVVDAAPLLWERLTVSRKRPRERIARWVTCSLGRIRTLRVQRGAPDVHNWMGSHFQQIRWGYLQSLYVDNWDVVRYFTSIGQLGILGSLRDISITWNTNELYPSFPDEMAAEYLRLASANLVEPWTQGLRNLRTLVLEDVGTQASDIVNVLEQNQSLEHLTLDRVFIIPSNAAASAPAISLPSLVSLTANNRSLLQAIVSSHMPSLTHLQLDTPGCPIDRFIKRLLEKSNPHLQVLRLRACRLDNTELLLALLINSPLLHTLELSKATNFTPILESLTPDPLVPKPSFLCPLLQSVNISYCSDLRTTHVVNFVRSRLPPKEPLPTNDSEAPQRPLPIRELILDGCRNIEPEWARWLAGKVPKLRHVMESKGPKRILY